MNHDTLKRYELDLRFKNADDPADSGGTVSGVYAESGAAALVQAVEAAAAQWAGAGAEIRVVDKDGNLRRFVGLELA